MEDLEQLKKRGPEMHHYYGDDVRKLFIGAAALMLITLPFFQNLLPVPAYISIIAIVTVAIVAGLTNPTRLWAAIINTGVSAIAVVVFEYYAVDAAIKYSGDSALFFVNQVLAIIFFIALYLSTKTWRAKALNK